MNDADALGTNTGTVTLTAGQYYPIQLVQFRGNFTNGSIQFYWKRPSQTAWQQDIEELYAEIPSSYTGISGITIPNSPQSSISQTLSNSTSAPITVKYVVTPVSSVTGHCVISKKKYITETVIYFFLQFYYNLKTKSFINCTI
jgi:hypothetical protein